MSDRVPGQPADAEHDPQIVEVAMRLAQRRPEPGATLRGQVRAFLSAVDASGLLIPRPRRLWLRVGACSIAGVALLVLVTAGVGGWGPFAT